MSRLRYNNAAGTLGASLTNVATGITFDAVPPFATIAAGDYIPLVLDPPEGVTPNADFEVVYLTAYAAGDTTGTIERGKEGTAGAAHLNGANWGCAPTAWDAACGSGADVPQPGDLGYDYEFMHPGSALPSGWAWTNQGDASYSEFIKGGCIAAPSAGGADFRILTQAAPASPFSVMAKIGYLSHVGDGYPGAGIVIGDAAGKLITLGVVGRNGEASITSAAWASATAWDSDYVIQHFGATPNWTTYLRMDYATPNVNFYHSLDGINWRPHDLGRDVSAKLGAPTIVGFGANPQLYAAWATCEWFRVR